MSDNVKRLRSKELQRDVAAAYICQEAANEIERLRAAIFNVFDVWVNTTDPDLICEAEEELREVLPDNTTEEKDGWDMTGDQRRSETNVEESVKAFDAALANNAPKGE